MNKKPNFLIGYGERLTLNVEIDRGGKTPTPPYSFAEAKQRVLPMVEAVAKDLAKLPDAACPDDYAVGLLTLHPQYTAKSYFPGKLLDAGRMQAIGSRPSTITPDKVRNDKTSSESETVQLFVSARRSDLNAFASNLPNWDDETRGADDLFKIEIFQAPTLKDRILLPKSKDKEPLLEIVLHTDAQLSPDAILESFKAFTETFGLRAELDRRFEVGGLCFLPLRASRELLKPLSQFSFLRIAREMPRLRPLRPIIRSGKKKGFACQLPKTDPMNPLIKAAVFDGGLPKNHSFGSLATLHESATLGGAVDEYVDHGVAVTSALLFGPLTENSPIPKPYGVVDHFRVLDNNPVTIDESQDLYDVLARIQSVLQQRRYDFVNLSLGPRLPIEDNEVHAWTAVLDEHLSDGNTVLTVAVGNDGELDHESGNARVQVPSDLVNALAVGSADTRGKAWRRASYSCIGPGRSPGRIKPDVVTFGGTESEPFYVLDTTMKLAVPTQGTSFASPYTLRKAMGIRTHFNQFSGLATKALLIHAAEGNALLSTNEIGWGRIPEELNDMVVCEDGIARVVYQGTMTPGHFLRMPIPMPNKFPDSCSVSIQATFCIASITDPQDPSNYTRSGLDIAFRPHAEKRAKNESLHAKTAAFFRATDFDSETELRHGAHKWETVMHANKKLRGTSLKDPIFDVRYQTRVAGKPSRGSDKIHYALIITVAIPKMPELYNEIIKRYRTQLEPLQPVIEIPVRT